MKKEKYITERVLANGVSFEVNFKYIDPLGKRQTYTKSFHSKNFANNSEALKAAIADRDKMRTILQTRGMKVKKVPTVKEVYEEKKKMFLLSEETNRKYDSLYRNYVDDLSDKPIDKIKAKDIMISLNKMIDKSQDEINRLFGLWKKLFQVATMNDYVYLDPTLKITVPQTEKFIKHRDCNMSCSIDDVFDAFMSYGYSEETKYNAKVLAYAFRINYYLGLRPAELFALTHNDFDMEKGLINIDKSIGTEKNDKSVASGRPKKVIKRTKTASSIRTLPIPDACVDDIKTVFNFARYEHIFKRYDGELMHSDYYSTFVLNVSKKAKITFNAYVLRHNFVTELVTNGVDIRTVQELAGHVSSTMTLSYARSNNDLKRQALNNNFKANKISDKSS